MAAYDSTLAAVQSNVSSDGFDLVEKQRDFGRAEKLVKTNAISIQGRDLAFTAARQSAAELAHDQATEQVATTDVAPGKACQAAVASKLALCRELQRRPCGDGGSRRRSRPVPTIVEA